MKLFGGFPYRFALFQAHRADDHFKGRNLHGPEDAFLVVALLDGGSQKARHADAVATHFDKPGLAVFI